MLLKLTFSRLHIIWSPSSYASAEIFRELKINQYEPDPKKAILVGADENPDTHKEEGASEGVNMIAEDLLRTVQLDHIKAVEDQPDLTGRLIYHTGGQ